MPSAKTPSHSAARPCTGRRLPRIRAPTIISVKVSGGKRESMAGRKGLERVPISLTGRRPDGYAGVQDYSYREIR